MLVGVISDTHGLLRPEAIAALAGSDRIVHAGDIGAPEILERLAAIAPVTAVRGNNDNAPWAADLPESAVLTVEGVSMLVLHDVMSLADDPATSGHSVVIAGHSHRPAIARRDGVLYVNPGSAGPRRFSLPIAIAHLRVAAQHAEATVLELVVGPKMPRTAQHPGVK